MNLNFRVLRLYRTKNFKLVYKTYKSSLPALLLTQEQVDHAVSLKIYNFDKYLLYLQRVYDCACDYICY